MPVIPVLFLRLCSFQRSFFSHLCVMWRPGCWGFWAKLGRLLRAFASSVGRMSGYLGLIVVPSLQLCLVSPSFSQSKLPFSCQDRGEAVSWLCGAERRCFHVFLLLEFCCHISYQSFWICACKQNKTLHPFLLGVWEGLKVDEYFSVCFVYS